MRINSMHFCETMQMALHSTLEQVVLIIKAMVDQGS